METNDLMRHGYDGTAPERSPMCLGNRAWRGDLAGVWPCQTETVTTSHEAFVIEHARATDLPAITAIYNSTIPSRMVTADLEPVSVESRRAWFEAHSEQRRPLWVARNRSDEADVLGWVGLQDFHPRCAYQSTAEVSVYVHAQRRGRGLGRALIQHAMSASSAVSVDTLVGLIFGHNAPSLALFAALGFERWGALPGVARLDEVRRDLVIVGRSLG